MKYLITVDVTSVTGSQTFEIDASSPEEAISKVESGEGDIISEQLEVESLNWMSARVCKQESKS